MNKNEKTICLEPIPIHSQLMINNIYTVYELTFSADFRFNGERHNFWEFIYIIEGSLGITSDDKIYECFEGDIFIHKPNAFHTCWTREKNEARALMITFSGAGLERFIMTGKMHSDKNDKYLINLLRTETSLLFKGYNINEYEKVIPNFSDNNEGYQIFKNCLEILCLLKRKGTDILCPPYMNEQSIRFEQIVSFLKDNLKCNLSSKEISKRLAIGGSSLKAIFKKFTNGGIIKFYNDLRCEYIIHLINSGHSMNEISLLMNFSSQNYFSYFFKKITGISPSQYSKNK